VFIYISCGRNIGTAELKVAVVMETLRKQKDLSQKTRGKGIYLQDITLEALINVAITV